MKYVILIFYALISIVCLSQDHDTMEYCAFPDVSAKPPYEINKLRRIIMDQNEEIPDCFDAQGVYYYNAIIMKNGSVKSLNLECVTENSDCFMEVYNPSSLEKWKPASKNGNNCNQKIRIRAYIY